ncbi:PhaM family polyhydroxyalkanoate granule multifunctional regulatory protein [Bordetella sp. 2513F-2]
MSDSSTNPFVLPGMGQTGELSGNPLLASMEMMRQAWSGLMGPGGLAQSVPMAPPMNLEELDRRIAELRTVEGWLRMNLSMLGSAIQGMEVQRATIATLRSFVDTAGSAGRASAEAGEASPLEIVLGLKPAPANKPAPAEKSASEDTGAPASGEAAPQGGYGAAHAASQAWWEMLQQQFNNIASATAASMAGMAPQGDAAPADQPAAPEAGAHAAAQAAAKPAASPAAPGAKPARKTARRTAAPAKRARKPAARKPPGGSA